MPPVRSLSTPASSVAGGGGQSQHLSDEGTQVGRAEVVQAQPPGRGAQPLPPVEQRGERVRRVDLPLAVHPDQ
nr:hypothetical protein GCM10020092_054080 [Actinoplanes digitatis]